MLLEQFQGPRRHENCCVELSMGCILGVGYDSLLSSPENASGLCLTATYRRILVEATPIV
jgi:hypothetical protein